MFTFSGDYYLLVYCVQLSYDGLFTMLHAECCACICFRITTQARSLLRLIPTDPSVVEALDSISQKVRYCSSCCSYCNVM